MSLVQPIIEAHFSYPTLLYELSSKGLDTSVRIELLLIYLKILIEDTLQYPYLVFDRLKNPSLE